MAPWSFSNLLIPFGLASGSSPSLTTKLSELRFARVKRGILAGVAGEISLQFKNQIRIRVWLVRFVGPLQTRPLPLAHYFGAGLTLRSEQFFGSRSRPSDGTLSVAKGFRVFGVLIKPDEAYS